MTKTLNLMTLLKGDWVYCCGESQISVSLSVLFGPFSFLRDYIPQVWSREWGGKKIPQFIEHSVGRFSLNPFVSLPSPLFLPSLSPEPHPRFVFSCILQCEKFENLRLIWLVTIK